MVKVDVFSDGIYIYDALGNEIVSWISDEWERDPSIVPSIANAVKLAFDDWDTLMRLLKKQ